MNSMPLFTDESNFKNNINIDLIAKGKVRDIYTVSKDENKYILFNTSDRCSAFDYQICNINMKGYYLTKIAVYWFLKLQHIVNNHYLQFKNNCLLVKKCVPIKLEFIVRGYITGSCWKGYSKGERVFSGVCLPDNLVKNQKLEAPVLTPTTKGEHDIPISKEEIVKEKYLSQSQLDFISQKCFELFNEGTKIASKKGLILVDTKYEFGFDSNNEICLIDEIHTPDSSRYWVESSYQNHLNDNSIPIQNLDKDAVRDYLNSLNFQDEINTFVINGGNLDNYTIPEIPEEVKHRVETTYHTVSKLFSFEFDNTDITIDNLNMSDITPSNSTTFNSSITPSSIEFRYFNHYFLNPNEPLVFILAGSKTDYHHTDKILASLQSKGINSVCSYISAHKNTLAVIECINNVHKLFKKVIWVTVAGRSNALSGVVAANTDFPVMACPPFKDKVDMMVNINSTLQMPSKTPVMTVLDIDNMVLCCARIFNL